MIERNILTKAIVIGLSLVACVLVASVLVMWDKTRSYDTYIWDYQPIKLYALISISVFIILNLFQAIENIITRRNRSLIASSLSGLYGHIIGTLIYFIIGLFVFDFQVKAYCLIIPMATTIIGFNVKRITIEISLVKKRTLIIANIILLVLWSLILIDFQLFLDYRKDVFENDRLYFDRIEKTFGNKSDSLSNLIMLAVDSKLLKKLNNDTIEKAIISQLQLHEKFWKYRQSNPLISQNKVVFFQSYSEMNAMLVIGFIFIALLNCIYIFYLRREQEGKRPQQSVKDKEW